MRNSHKSALTLSFLNFRHNLSLSVIVTVVACFSPSLPVCRYNAGYKGLCRVSIRFLLVSALSAVLNTREVVPLCGVPKRESSTVVPLCGVV